MKAADEPERMFCLTCAEAFARIGVRAAICPHCGARTALRQYRVLMRYAYGAYHCGVQYDRAYERDAAQGRRREFYIAPAPEEMTWIALAALSGIIGGASWETVKIVVKQIIKRQRGRRASRIRLKPNELEDIEHRLRRYVGEHGKAARDEQAIRKLEDSLVRAEEPVLTLPRLGMKRAPGLDSRRRRKVRRDIRKMLRDAYPVPPDKALFKEFWNRLPKSIARRKTPGRADRR